MPSSLIFVGLVVAWLLILVPIVARRRQEVARPSEAALASRVLRRPATSRRTEEVSVMVEEPGEDRAWDELESALDVEADNDEPAAEQEPEPDIDQEPAVEPVDEPELLATEPIDAPAQRRYRTGRGGYDPEAAMLAAQARCSFRQRVVLGLLLAAFGTAILAAVDVAAWWPHVVVDLALVGYLMYLRRQVRVEEDLRRRRTSRLAGTPQGARRRTVAEYVAARQRAQAQAAEESVYADDYDAGSEAADPTAPATADAEADDPELLADDEPGLPPLRSSPLPERPPGTAVIDLDDEDPGLHELGDTRRRGYQRAAGE